MQDQQPKQCSEIITIIAIIIIITIITSAFRYNLLFVNYLCLCLFVCDFTVKWNNYRIIPLEMLWCTEIIPNNVRLLHIYVCKCNFVCVCVYTVLNVSEINENVCKSFEWFSSSIFSRFEKNQCKGV